MIDNEDERNSTATTGSSDEFSAVLCETQKLHDMGSPTAEIIFRLARTRETEVARFCLERLAQMNADTSDMDLIRQFCQIDGPANRLVDLLLKEEVQRVQTVGRALVKLGVSFHLKFAAHLSSDDPSVVGRALELIDISGDNKLVIPALFAVLNRSSSAICVRAASLIQKLDSRYIYTRRLLRHPDARVRANTLQSIMIRTDADSDECLALSASDPDSRIRFLAGFELWRRGAPTGKRVLREMLKDSDPRTRFRAAWALGIDGAIDIIPSLETLERDDPDGQVRKQAAQSIARIKDQKRCIGP